MGRARVSHPRAWCALRSHVYFLFVTTKEKEKKKRVTGKGKGGVSGGVPRCWCSRRRDQKNECSTTTGQLDNDEELQKRYSTGYSYDGCI